MFYEIVWMGAYYFIIGKLERLDLTGNTHCYQPTHASLLADTQCNGKPIVILPFMPVSNAPYDDDP